MEFIRKNAWAFVLGGGLAFIGDGILTWQWWAVMVPVAILVEWSKSVK